MAWPERGVTSRFFVHTEYKDRTGVTPVRKLHGCFNLKSRLGSICQPVVKTGLTCYDFLFF